VIATFAVVEKIGGQRGRCKYIITPLATVDDNPTNYLSLDYTTFLLELIVTNYYIEYRVNIVVILV
jgi:hypothetical protein